MNSVKVPTTASVKSEASRNGSQSSSKWDLCYSFYINQSHSSYIFERSKKGNSDLYRYNLEPDSDDELQRPKEEARSSSVSVNSKHFGWIYWFVIISKVDLISSLRRRRRRGGTGCTSTCRPRWRTSRQPERPRTRGTRATERTSSCSLTGRDKLLSSWERETLPETSRQKEEETGLNIWSPS